MRRSGLVLDVTRAASGNREARRVYTVQRVGVQVGNLGGRSNRKRCSAGGYGGDELGARQSAGTSEVARGEFVTVHPVDPEPPPNKMSPVEVPPMPTVPAPLPSTVRLPVPEMAVPDTFSELTAADDSVPPVMVAPLMVPEVEMVVIPDRAPATLTSKFVESMTSGADPPPRVICPELEPVLILVAKFELLFMLAVAPDTVRPNAPCRSPAPESTPTAVNAPVALYPPKSVPVES